MTSTVRDSVAEFFDRFDRADDAPDSVDAAALFHPTLLNLDPVSVGMVTREQVVASLPLRKQFFAELGISRMRLESLSESPIDDRHTLVRSTWRLETTPDSATANGTLFTSTYLLRKAGNTWQVVVYLNHQDLRALADGR